MKKYQYINERRLKKVKEFKLKLNEEKNIKNYKVNNKLDLEKIINDFSTYIFTIINNMSKSILNSEDIEEIISDVFFILWKNRNKLDENKLLSSYLAGITKNVVRQYLRKNKIHLNISDYENNLYFFDDIEMFDDNILKIKNIERKLNYMKDVDKKIFIDFYYYSKSIKDIAKEVNLTVTNVKTKLFRIRKKIREEG